MGHPGGIHSAGRADCPFWVLFFHWTNDRPRSPTQCSALSAWGKNKAIEVKPVLLLSNVVLLSLCASGGASDSPSGSEIFTVVSCIWIIATSPSSKQGRA